MYTPLPLVVPATIDGETRTTVVIVDVVTGLIKTILALTHRELPPTLHFERPNPELDLENGPFRVRSTLVPWDTDRLPRRAGVSSFGIGGTNAHVIVQEAPPRTEPRAEASSIFRVGKPSFLPSPCGLIAPGASGVTSTRRS